MEIINFIKDYWVLISFFIGEIGALFLFVKSINKGTKCSLRNDILNIYDRCKENKQITKYQLQSIEYSYDLYKKLGGNSFVDKIKEEIEEFEIKD
mgnify:CR=1 FL=1